MNSRERILCAVDGGTPDRIPGALNFYHVDIEQLAPPGEYHDGMVDIRFISFPVSPEEAELSRIGRPYSPDTRLGNPSQLITYTRWQYEPSYGDKRNPLTDARSLDDFIHFPFPDTHKPYLVDDLASQVASLHARGLAVGGGLPHLGGELFEAAWRLRGLKNFLIDLVIRPEWADFLLDRLCDLAIRNAQTITRAGIDILALDDDIGMPRTMMISPTHWRRFFKPRFAGIIRAAREINPDLKILFHSDGFFEPIIGDLIEIGVNVINPIQPDHMDAVRIRKQYGIRVALWGTVGYQTTFSFATPDRIREEVKHRIDTIGRAGLVLCPAYDIDEPDIPWENIAAFLHAVRDFG